MVDSSIYKKLYDYSTIGQKEMRFSVDNLLKEYKGTPKETIMRTIFSYFDGLDCEQDGVLNFANTHGDSTEGTIAKNIRIYLGDWENEVLSEEKIKSAMGDDVSLKDVEEAIQKVMDIYDETNGKTLDQVSGEDFQKVYNLDGSEYAFIDNNPCSADTLGGNITKTIQYYNEDNLIVEIFYESGAKSSVYKNKEVFEFVKTKYNFSQGNMTDFVVNAGLPNESKFVVKTDSQGKLTDILDSDGVVNASFETKQILKLLINQGFILGVDFDLKTDCNELKIEIIKDENLPKAVKSDIDELGYRGLRKNIDYRVSVTPEGDCVLEYLTNTARDFSLNDIKKIVYSQSGSKTTIEDIRQSAPKVEVWEIFDIQQTDFVNKLPYYEKIHQISETKYSQKIGNNSFNVEMQNNKIVIEKDGKEFSINTSDMTNGMKNLLFNTNPAALFRIAEKGITIKFEKPLTGGDGEWIPEENTIYIAPNASSIPILQRRIAHEAGHSYYTADMPKNKELEEMFKQESKNVPISIQFTNEGYCSTNVYEFVAEAYCLLATGHAKSEYTIAQFYPKTFELVKQMLSKQ